MKQSSSSSFIAPRKLFNKNVISGHVINVYGYGGEKIHVVNETTIAYICGRGVKFLNLKDGTDQYFWPDVYYESLYTTSNVDMVNELKNNSTATVTNFNSSMTTVNNVENYIVRLQEEEGKLNGSGTNCIAFNQQLRVFAIGEKILSPKIHLYQYNESLTSFERIQVLLNGTRISYSSLDFSRDGQWLVSLGSIPDHKITVWNWKTGEKIVETDGAMHSNTISFNPRNKMQICTSGNTHLAFWTIHQTADGYEIAAEEPKVSEMIYEQIKNSEKYYHVWGTSGEIFCGTSDGDVLLFSSIFDQGKLLSEYKDAIHSITISKQYLILGLEDSMIRFYSLSKLRGGSASSRTVVSLTDALVKQIVINSTFSGGEEDPAVSHIRMSGDFQSLIAGTSDGSMYRIPITSEIATGPSDTDEYPAELLYSSHTGGITGLEHLAMEDEEALTSSNVNPTVVVTCGVDGSLRVWNYETNTLLLHKQFSASFTSLAISNNGKKVYLGSSSGYLRIVELEWDKETKSNIRARVVYCKKLRNSAIIEVKGIHQRNKERKNDIADSIICLTYADQHLGIVGTFRLDSLGSHNQTPKSADAEADDDMVDIDVTRSEIKNEDTVVIGFAKFSSPFTAMTWSGTDNDLYVATEDGDLLLLTIPSTPSELSDMTIPLGDISKETWRLDYTCHGLIVSKENPTHIYTISQDKSIKYYELTAIGRGIGNVQNAVCEVDSHLKIGECMASSLSGELIASAASDGIIWLRRATTNLEEQESIHGENKGNDAVMFFKHDPIVGGVTRVSFSLDGTHLVSAGNDGTVQVFRLQYDTVNSKAEPLKTIKGLPRFKLGPSILMDDEEYHNSSSAPAAREEDLLLNIVESADDPTFLELKIQEHETIERVLNEAQKESLKQQVSDLRNRFQELKKENIEAPEDERLSQDELIVDHEYLNQMKLVADEKVEALQKKIRHDNYAREILTRKLKEECWDTMQTRLVILTGFNFENTVNSNTDTKEPKSTEEQIRVPNYVIRKVDAKFELTLKKIRFMRRTEEISLQVRRTECVTGNLEGGVPVDDSVILIEDDAAKNNKANHPFKLSRVNSIDPDRGIEFETPRSYDDQYSDYSDDDRHQGYVDRDRSRKKSTSQRRSLTWKQTRELVMKNLERDDNNLKYHPFDLYTRQRKVTQIHLLNGEIRKLMIAFNEKFDTVQDQKNKTITRINQINDKILEILAELNKGRSANNNNGNSNLSSSVKIFEPIVPNSENPEHILSVTIEDMPFKERYVSPEELAKRQEQERIEQERLQREQSGNVAERALMMMMDGKLTNTSEEANAENELTPPEFYGKPDLTEQEMKVVKEYEIKKRQKEEEKEKRIKQLEAKLKNAMQQVKDLCNLFDKSLQNLLKERYETDSQIYELELTCIKLAQSINIQEETEKTETEMMQIVSEMKLRKAASATQLQEFKKKIDTRKAEYLQIQQEDRNFEDSFKSEFAKVIGSAAGQHILYEHQTGAMNAFSPRAANRNADVRTSGNQQPLVQQNPKHLPSDKEILDRLNKMFRNRPKMKPNSQLEMEIASKAESKLDPFADVDIANEMKSIVQQDVLDYNKDKIPQLSSHVWSDFWKMRQMKIDSDREIVDMKQQLESMNQQVDRLRREDERLNELLSSNMTELNNFKSKITRETFNLDKVFKFKQGQVEVEQAAVVTDYSDAILIAKNIVQNYNQTIISAASENIKQMVKSKDVKKKIGKTEWENTLIQFETDDTLLKHTELQMTKVTKRIQQLIKGGSSEERKKQEQIKLQSMIEHAQSTLHERLAERAKQMKRMEKIMNTKQEENLKLSTQLKLLQELVNEREELYKLQASTREKEQMDKKMKELRWERRLKEQIQQQDEELALLRTNLDKMRRRSFPVFAVVQRRKIN